ncbi:flavin reductase family protein [Gulosibacter molinativorax]|uniref:Flavin reductase n=1 Tax=Gulosibacter molinativorax TaxID=256821 RepID=A0ABT7C7P7_9MICO|nr:flavin reductase family protein [Gulosibacter molinativorax]MDJ1370784.1 flavin reductase [Gulosibacter molinativorax]QUY63187.1 Flavin reductase domain-containing protein [Gulosibacter molinativorax]
MLRGSLSEISTALQTPKVANPEVANPTVAGPTVAGPGAAVEEPTLGQRLRAVHKRYPTGVTIVTVLGSDGQPRGLAVNAFASISYDPPLIMVAINATSSTYPWLFSADHLAINVIAEDQMPIVRAFAKKGGDKFAGLDWQEGVTGSPILAGVTGHFELAIKYKMPAYTHTIFIGEVVAAEAGETPALIYRGAEFFLGSDLTPVEE